MNASSTRISARVLEHADGMAKRIVIRKRRRCRYVARHDFVLNQRHPPNRGALIHRRTHPLVFVGRLPMTTMTGLGSRQLSSTSKIASAKRNGTGIRFSTLKSNVGRLQSNRQGLGLPDSHFLQASRQPPSSGLPGFQTATFFVGPERSEARAVGAFFVRYCTAGQFDTFVHYCIVDTHSVANARRCFRSLIDAHIRPAPDRR